MVIVIIHRSLTRRCLAGTSTQDVSTDTQQIQRWSDCMSVHSACHAAHASAAAEGPAAAATRSRRRRAARGPPATAIGRGARRGSGGSARARGRRRGRRRGRSRRCRRRRAGSRPPPTARGGGGGSGGRARRRRLGGAGRACGSQTHNLPREKTFARVGASVSSDASWPLGRIATPQTMPRWASRSAAREASCAPSSDHADSVPSQPPQTRRSPQSATDCTATPTEIWRVQSPLETSHVRSTPSSQPVAAVYPSTWIEVTGAGWWRVRMHR